MAIRNHSDFVIEINAMLEQAESLMSAECCIYRVPYDIRRLKEDAFTPKVISIGPFHYGLPRLQNVEKYKLVCVKQFFQRSSTTSLDGLISFVEDIEPGIRRCYSDTIELSREEFVKVILVDSCFLFELFLRSFYGDWLQDDAINLKPWLISTIRLDLLLLENQLPYFHLEKIFNLACSPSKHRLPSFLELTSDYFAYYNSMKLPLEGVRISHFTDLIRTFYLPPLNERPGRRCESVIHLPSATELVEAGVRFKRSKSLCLLNLKFSGRVLKIPELKVEDCTEILFRNLIALEQCHYPTDSYLTDYVAVMDFLINTSTDVDVLVRKGVILNWLGETNSVADLFNSLWKNVTYVDFNSDYLKLCKDLNAFCKNRCHKMKANLRHDYCNTPWQTAASVAGILILVFTLTQTISSIIQVVLQYKQGSSP